MSTTLETIGKLCGTDKGTRHSYLEVYEVLLAPFKLLGELNLLEVGVAYGSSLDMWKQWFPKIRLTGIDINPRAYLERPVVEQVHEVLTLDSTNRSAIDKALDKRQFDVIVDDGSHEWKDQLETYRNLSGFLKDSSSLYFVEDCFPASVDAFMLYNPVVLDRRSVRGTADDILLILGGHR